MICIEYLNAQYILISQKNHNRNNIVTQHIYFTNENLKFQTSIFQMKFEAHSLRYNSF